MNRARGLMLILSFCALSCQPRRFNSETLSTNQFPFPTDAIQCGNQEIPVVLSMKSISSIPGWHSIQATHPLNNIVETMNWRGPGKDSRYRIDLCTDFSASRFMFKQILAEGKTERLRIRALPQGDSQNLSCETDGKKLDCTVNPENVTLDGVSELLLSGKTEKLKMIVPIVLNGANLYHVVVPVQSDSKAVIATLASNSFFFASTQQTASPLLGRPPRMFLDKPTVALLGALEQGDSFSNAKCEIGWRYEEKKVLSFAKTKITIERCIKETQTSGRTVQTRELSFEVEEMDSVVSGGTVPLVFRATRENGLERLKKTQTHHNFQDSFVFDLPHATYTLKQDLLSGSAGSHLIHFTIKPLNGSETSGTLGASETFY